LHESASQSPSSCLAIPAFYCIAGSVTDTLNHNWDSAYANEFPFAADDLDVDKLKIIAKEAIVFYEWT